MPPRSSPPTLGFDHIAVVQKYLAKEAEAKQKAKGKMAASACAENLVTSEMVEGGKENGVGVGGTPIGLKGAEEVPHQEEFYQKTSVLETPREVGEECPSVQSKGKKPMELYLEAPSHGPASFGAYGSFSDSPLREILNHGLPISAQDMQQLNAGLDLNRDLVTFLESSLPYGTFVDMAKDILRSSMLAQEILRALNARICHELPSLRLNKQEEVLHLRNEIQALRQQNLLLKRDSEAVQLSKAELEGRVRHFREKEEAYEAQLASYVEAASKWEEEKQQLIREKEHLQKENNEAVVAQLKLASDLQTMVAEHAHLKNTFEASSKQIKALTKEIHCQQDNKQELVKAFAEEKAELVKETQIAAASVASAFAATEALYRKACFNILPDMDWAPIDALVKSGNVPDHPKDDGWMERLAQQELNNKKGGGCADAT